MDTTVLVFTIGALALIILAFLASIINVEFEWPDGKLPKIKLQFQKDQSLWGLLKGEKNEKKNEILINEDINSSENYVIEFLHSEIQITYGEKSESTMKRIQIIKSLNDYIDEYYYFNSNSDTKIQLNEGYSEKTNKFKRLREFSTWEGIGDENLRFNKIILKIPKLLKDEKTRLVFSAKIYGHYLENIQNANKLSHTFSFVAHATTESSFLTCRIPLGKNSTIFKIIFINEYRSKEILLFKLDSIEEKIINLDQGDLINIICDKSNITIHWVIPYRVFKGSMNKIVWYTKKIH